ncbi:hypothetical protein [Cohnella rhizosphaerae]|uniref:Uncharacterized protein n=1 Tax=Cohnella rhizosphaerae TaxID=1457232 RepID=A0A9X4QSI2_9BACL|nr:hypothetical protein [Cohnella rhizosphaerae]MDG0808587.1 hypothetical protein [Cohnella rhizosphaerae]
MPPGHIDDDQKDGRIDQMRRHPELVERQHARLGRNDLACREQRVHPLDPPSLGATDDVAGHGREQNDKKQCHGANDDRKRQRGEEIGIAQHRSVIAQVGEIRHVKGVENMRFVLERIQEEQQKRREEDRARKPGGGLRRDAKRRQRGGSTGAYAIGLAFGAGRSVKRRHLRSAPPCFASA